MKEILTDRQLNILSSYYGLDNKEAMLQKEIADKYSITRQRVQQIIDKSIKRLQRSGKIQKLNPYR